MTGPKRSLSFVGGPTAVRGDAELGRVLAAALDVPSSLEAEALARAHLHGFHAYPARLHPATAARLIESLSRPGERVLDPFAGSGTVLLEARLAGREALGADLNPLAVRLSRLKVEGRGEAARGALVEAARRVAAVSDARRKGRAGPSRRYGPEDLEAFDRHVLLALDGLRLGVGQEPPALAADLALVLSSILVKLSRRASDTAPGRGAGPTAPPSFSQRLPARLFVRKTEELAARLAEVSDRLAEGPPPRVETRDARDLSWVAPGSVSLVVSSPPYPGVYDYLHHHDLRLRWLDLEVAPFARGEIGPRRAGADPARARAAFSDAVAEVLAGLARSLRPGGHAVLVAGDGAFGPSVVRFDELLEALAPEAGLAVRAVASQRRGEVRGVARREHAVALRPSATDSPPRRARQARG